MTVSHSQKENVLEVLSGDGAGVAQRSEAITPRQQTLTSLGQRAILRSEQRSSVSDTGSNGEQATHLLEVEFPGVAQRRVEETGPEVRVVRHVGVWVDARVHTIALHLTVDEVATLL